MADEAEQSDILKMTTKIVVAYVDHNSVAADQMPDVITKVYGSLQAVNAGDGAAREGPLKPAVSMRSPIKADYIICLDDGKTLKMRRRHIKSDHGMSTEEYRAKWGLPGDYPMIAPNYAKQRSEISKKNEFGWKPGYSPRKRGGRDAP